MNLFFIPVFLLFSLAIQAQTFSATEICKQFSQTEIPANDQPDKQEILSLKGCDSQSLYYGIEHPVDYAKARACAFSQRQNEEQYIFGASSVLMMLYANGYGVAKNIPLAQRFACEVGGAPAELQARLKHLEKMKPDLKDSEAFDLCDDITSGFMMGACAGNQERIANKSRSAKIKIIMSKWSETEKQSFTKLENAFKEFQKHRIENEIDLSGSARSMFQTQEQAIQVQDFIESLEKLEKKRAPQYSLSLLKTENKKLDNLLEQIQRSQKTWGTVTAEGIQKTQKSWLKYREAWIEFAQYKYPDYPKERISIWFTKKRNHMLKSFIQ